MGKHFTGGAYLVNGWNNVEDSDALVTRLEYRRDWSDAPYFERGTGGTYKSQSTLLVGLVA